MIEESIKSALKLVKLRLNRADTVLDEYLEQRVRAAAGQLRSIGITLADSAEDIMLLADYAAWEYGNRDQAGSMPEWLRLIRRERWLNERMKENDS